MSLGNNSIQDDIDDSGSSLSIYRSIRTKASNGKGKRIHFQFSLDEVDLYHSKLKTKHQLEPIPITRGTEAHYSYGANYILKATNDDFTEFVLRHNDSNSHNNNNNNNSRNNQTNNDDNHNDHDDDDSSSRSRDVEGNDDPNSQVLIIKFAKKKRGPKKVAVRYTESDQTIKLVSRKAEKTDIGKWCLDFDGRYAEPSIKNCILVDGETHETMAMFRRVDQWEMNVDAKPDMPDIMLFAILLCLNICPF